MAGGVPVAVLLCHEVHGDFGSVSLANSTPWASSSRRSVAKFSMMPLCTTANLPPASLCGWALRSVGRP